MRALHLLLLLFFASFAALLWSIIADKETFPCLPKCCKVWKDGGGCNKECDNDCKKKRINCQHKGNKIIANSAWNAGHIFKSQQYHPKCLRPSICFTSIAIKLYISCHIFTCVRFYCPPYINRCGHCSVESAVDFVKLSNVFVFYSGRERGDYLAVCRLDAVAV